MQPDNPPVGARADGPPHLRDLPSLAFDPEAEALTPAVPTAPLPRGRLRPYLIAIAGARTGEIFPIGPAGSALLIGRGPEARLHLPDDQVSRRHAEVRVVSEGLVRLRDLLSSNGTYVRGRRIRERLLRHGDRVMVGDGNLLRVAWLDPIEERFQRQLADGALRDVLTPAYNQRYLRQRLCTELAFAQRHNTPIALLFIDVDHFKQVNDRFGHLMGDQVLKKLAETLLSELRSEDVLARWGGEEFAVLARSTTDLPALVLGERIRHKVAATKFQHGHPVHVSIGIAIYPQEIYKELPARSASSEDGARGGTSLADQLIGSADEALYCAKHRGRNQVATSEGAP